MHAHARGDGAGPGGVVVRPRCARWLLVPVLLAGGAAGGCTGFWDEVTSRDFHFKDVFKKAPDPMWVIQNSPDGDKKAKAFRTLKEPAQNGGSQQEQDSIVQLLTWTAANDPQAVCRMAAIDTLRHFRDPRAVAGLKHAYYRADSFPPETATPLRCMVLGALGDTGQADAVDLLVKALGEPPVEGNEVEKQQKEEERIAAARALGHFPQYQATEALVAALRTTPDVALRNRARESLVKVTGKDLPPDAQAWDDFLHSPAGKDAVAGSSGVFDKFIQRISHSSSE